MKKSLGENLPELAGPAVTAVMRGGGDGLGAGEV